VTTENIGSRFLEIRRVNLGPVVDESANFSKARKLRILVYALHTTTPYGSGYIGGAWVRLLEFLKRAKKFNIEYILTEPSPKLGDAYKLVYESISMNSHGYEKILDTAFLMLEATIRGVRRAIKRDIDLVLSPLGAPHCIIPAFATSFLTRIPCAVIIHNVPVFHGLIERLPNLENHSPSFRTLYRCIRYHKHRGKRIHYVIFSTMLNYIVYKLLRTTVIIGIGSAVRYLAAIDNRLPVREIFPANSIPSSVIEETEEIHEDKECDALFVGFLAPEKGILDAIQAWSLVTKKNPSLNLFLIGKAKDGRILKLIDTLIERYSLKDNIHFLCDPLQGASPEILWKTMKKSRILIFPSTEEAWSLTVGEALAFGLPVVGYDILALKRAYANCEAIIRVPVGDKNRLADEAIRLLEDPRQIAILSKKACEYMKNYFTWSQVISAERALYEEFCRK
jgi:glycosyltransferase involved in cell wall biosynthesis